MQYLCIDGLGTSSCHVNEYVYTHIRNRKCKSIVIQADEPGGIVYWALKAVKKNNIGHVTVLVSDQKSMRSFSLMLSKPEFAKYSGLIHWHQASSQEVLKNLLSFSDYYIGSCLPDVLPDFKNACALTIEKPSRWNSEYDKELGMYVSQCTQTDSSIETCSSLNIALLVPTRNRVAWCRRLADSLDRTCVTQKVTLVLGVDTDDPDINGYKQLAKDNKRIRMHFIPSDGTFKGVSYLWNELAFNSKEEILALIGDDMEFMTKGWDEEILYEFSQFSCPADKIKLVYCHDGYRPCDLAVNFFIHRQYMALTGYFVRPGFLYDQVDIWAHNIFAALKRIKARPDLCIMHHHWSIDKKNQDHTTDRMRGSADAMDNDKQFKSLLQDRVKEALLLGTHTGIHPDCSLL